MRCNECGIQIKLNGLTGEQRDDPSQACLCKPYTSENFVDALLEFLIASDTVIYFFLL